MDEIQKLIDKTIKQLKNKYEVIGEGRNRIVFLKDDNTVIKFPLREYGMYDNQSEADRFFRYGKTGDIIPSAKCSIFFLNNIALLEMERIHLLKDQEVPKWADYVDCQQVGVNKDGVILAYNCA